MQYGTVTGRFLSADGDPLSGEIRFTPEVGAVVVAGPPPLTIFPAHIVGQLDTEGHLCDPDELVKGVLKDGATRGLRLVAPEPGITNPGAWEYAVHLNLRAGVQAVSAPFPNITVTPAGLDLATMAEPTEPTTPTEPAVVTVTETTPGTYELSGATVTETSPGTYELSGGTVTETSPGTYTIGA